MISNYSQIDLITNILLVRILEILGDKLVGLYLYGSAVWGDFDPDVSDVDLLAALKTDLSEEEFQKLSKFHIDIQKAQPEWEDRIEVKYFSLDGLRNFKSVNTKMANVSPGEPLHIINDSMQFLLSLYFVQNYGKILFGVNPKEIIPNISKKEFIAKVKEDAIIRSENVKSCIDSKPYQGFYVMTMCRALYTITFGEQVSKRKASLWVIQKYPQWSELISDAFKWRKNFRNIQGDPQNTYLKTKEFVNFISSEIMLKQ